MTTPETGADEVWGKLATAPEGERTAQTLARYRELATQPEAERRAQLQAMARAEYALPDDQLRAMTLSRLQAYLQMEPEEVRTVVASLDAVMNQLPGTMAMRRVALVQTLAREFSLDDQQRLHDLVPNVFGERIANVPEAAPSAPAQPARAKKAWWAFWKKD